ncbi:TolC family protein [Haliangium sp.]|uniref:TolC family protein n=1 Tax=Haliangium sp. TaxID=2663208 RepID=UPI003D0CBABD
MTLATALSMQGCASSPSPAPRHASARAPAQIDHDEVRVPDVPLPEPVRGAPVTLDEVLVYADRHAPGLVVARQRRGLGDAAVIGASMLLPDEPELSVGAGPRLTEDGTHLDVTASLRQRVELGGERGLRRDAAAWTQARLHAELDEARWEVHRDVHAAFHRALVARERVVVAERLVAFQDRLLEITRGRLRAGEVSPLAVRLAEGELSQARVGRIAAEQAYLRARLELGAIAGWPASHPPEPAGGLDQPRDPPTGAELAAAAERHQPRLRTLHAARAEAEARARVAEREAWPTPTLGVEVTREGAPPGLEETVVLGTVSVPIPLFRRSRGARAVAAAERGIAAARQDAFGSQLPGRIAQHRSEVLAAAERLRTYGREILPSFEDNLRLLRRGFELGEIDILQVSVARERFLLIQADALDAYDDYFEAVAALEAVIGSDLWPSERHEHRLELEPNTEERP